MRNGPGKLLPPEAVSHPSSLSSPHHAFNTIFSQFSSFWLKILYPSGA